jgi:methylated-DNA-[protein]-cysteine S-methyltransferase
VSVTRVSSTAPLVVPYTAEGWGEGEVWFEGGRLLWHELPRARMGTRARATPTHSTGGENSPPSASTMAAEHRRMGNGSAPNVERLVHKLEAYFAAERVTFGDTELDLDGWTPFQLDVARALRRVPYGEVVSYSELARLAGYPRAQRAAGTFCARNRFPIIVPCHRVVAADGLGSYGALGVDYKQRLLALEGVRL